MVQRREKEVNAAEARKRLEFAHRLRLLARDEEMGAKTCLDDPVPGSVVKHFQHGTIGVIKDQNGQLMLDLHSNEGLRPIGKEELMNWDVIQEPNE